MKTALYPRKESTCKKVDSEVITRIFHLIILNTDSGVRGGTAEAALHRSLRLQAQDRSLRSDARTHGREQARGFGQLQTGIQVFSP
jgi:hypothetical protein